MKKVFITFLLLSAFAWCEAQNLVKNPDFEELSKKVKAKGMIELAEGWYSPTNAPANLYATSGKDDLIKVPENEYGDEKPKAGENYAGLVFYSYRERDPRTYLSTRLTEPLEKGEHYCIRFHVSLADLAKYAVDNIGLYVSEDSIYQEGTGILTYTPQIIHSTNRIFNQQWDWEAICRIYVAKGGEQYITIGNFAKQDEVQYERVKRPRGYSSTQMNEAYYYIDDISVMPGGTPANCKCEKGNFAFAHLDKEEKSFGSNPEDAPKTEFISSTGEGKNTKAAENLKEDIIVPFPLAKSSIEDPAKAKLDEAITYLKENEDVKVDIIAHIDQSEVRLTGLSEKRMNEVKKYLISQGIEQGRISETDVKDAAPLDDSGLKENREKNTVVEIKFRK